MEIAFMIFLFAPTILLVFSDSTVLLRVSQKISLIANSIGRTSACSVHVKTVVRKLM